MAEIIQFIVGPALLAFFSFFIGRVGIPRQLERLRGLKERIELIDVLLKSPNIRPEITAELTRRKNELALMVEVLSLDGTPLGISFGTELKGVFLWPVRGQGAGAFLGHLLLIFIELFLVFALFYTVNDFDQDNVQSYINIIGVSLAICFDLYLIYVLRYFRRNRQIRNEIEKKMTAAVP